MTHPHRRNTNWPSASVACPRRNHPRLALQWVQFRTVRRVRDGVGRPRTAPETHQRMALAVSPTEWPSHDREERRGTDRQGVRHERAGCHPIAAVIQEKSTYVFKLLTWCIVGKHSRKRLLDIASNEHMGFAVADGFRRPANCPHSLAGPFYGIMPPLALAAVRRRASAARRSAACTPG